MKTLTILLFALSINLSAQLSEITRFPLQDTTVSITRSQLFEAPNGNLIMFWREDGNLFMSKSLDDGSSWESKILVVNDIQTNGANNYLIRALTTDDNKIILAYVSNLYDNNFYNTYYVKYLFSSDNGDSWTASKKVVDAGVVGMHFSLSKTLSGEIWMVFNSHYIKSIDNGNTWSDLQLLVDQEFTYKFTSTSIQSLNDSTLILFYKNNAWENILYRISDDSGISWDGEKEFLFDFGLNGYCNSVVSSLGDVYLTFQDYNGDIYFLKNKNKRNEWDEPIKFTHYAGPDDYCKPTIYKDKIGISFASHRWKRPRPNSVTPYEYNIWFGILEQSIDKKPPPFIKSFNYSPFYPLAMEPIIFNSDIYDEDSLQYVKLNIFYDEVLINSFLMRDSNNENNYSVTFNNLEYHDLVTYSITVLDNQNNLINSGQYQIAIESPYGNSTYLLDVNNIEMPISNNGVLGDVYFGTEGYKNITFDSETIVYSSGFFISGKSGEEIFSNGIFRPTRISGIYKPGVVGSNQADGRNVIHVVKSSDTPFDISWKNWENAVSHGAHFYDGDNDGVYNPVDKNNNGLWDVNEDKPDLIGDITAWCVYNDADDGNLITPYSVNMGIEIKQTLFASKALEFESLQNVVFVRYEIENKNSLVAKYDSVYFGILPDPDIGADYGDDLVGSDTLLHAGYAYLTGPSRSCTIIAGGLSP